MLKGIVLGTVFIVITVFIVLLFRSDKKGGLRERFIMLKGQTLKAY